MGRLAGLTPAPRAILKIGVMRMPDREKVLNDLQDAVNDYWMWQHADYYAKAIENAIALLKEQNGCENCAIAIEDRLTVVRCKDCRYWTSEKILEYHICKRWKKTGVKNFATAWNWFCADGERKEGQ